jgi:hypothetical protein
LFLPADRERVLCIFSELPEIQFESKKPIFVFAHIMLPHGPYVWGPNGEHKKIASLMHGVEEDKKAYVDQLKFTNKMVQEMIEKIMDEKKRPKIIIIQSDHGDTAGKYKSGSAWTHDRLSNINYILLPDKNENPLYNTMTPVNTFRVLFNDYFNTNFEVLEDIVFDSGYDTPYDFSDVTHLFGK